ncbi:hypothetical protein [Pseudooceanicola sp.]|uniref:hypothetical protein n=1 Tax=Pseudooceanicola sp. TaxID=1914328 RepID=UPI002630BFBE|nr:hypothetical protein [Pseudooceanicola sp.]MDF1854296.1 hypothetical protein [Pseudooceanicola sp.]
MKIGSTHVSLLVFASLVAMIGEAVSAQESRIVPLFGLYHSDNAFGGTSADRIFRGGIEVDTPDELRATSDTVLSAGAIWLNAIRTDLGGMPFTLSPFVRHRSFLESGEHSTAFGAALSFRFHDGPNDRLDLRATVARFDASWASDAVDDVSLRLGYRRTIESGARLDFGLTGGWQSLVTSGSVSRVGFDAEYRDSFGEFDLTADARFNLRSSDVSGRSGHDVGLGLRLGRDIGPGQAYTQLGVDWEEDQNARSGQPAARSETNTLAEIGYAVSLDASGLGRFTIYARQERSNANLAIYDATTNVFGMGLRLGF